MLKYIEKDILFQKKKKKEKTLIDNYTFPVKYKPIHNGSSDSLGNNSGGSERIRIILWPVTTQCLLLLQEEVEKRRRRKRESKEEKANQKEIAIQRLAIRAVDFDQQRIYIYLRLYVPSKIIDIK